MGKDTSLAPHAAPAVGKSLGKAGMLKKASGALKKTPSAAAARPRPMKNTSGMWAFPNKAAFKKSAKYMPELLGAHAGGGEKKKRKNGAAARTAIRELQHSSRLIIPYLPFVSIVKRITNEQSQKIAKACGERTAPDEKKFQRNTIDEIRTIVEAVVNDTLRRAYEITTRCGRTTVQPGDLDLASKHSLLA